jgi:hypothetical protein
MLRRALETIPDVSKKRDAFVFQGLKMKAVCFLEMSGNKNLMLCVNPRRSESLFFPSSWSLRDPYL